MSSSIENLKRFMFIGLNVNFLNIKESESILNSIEQEIKNLINEGKGYDILKELTNFSKLYQSQLKLKTNHYTVKSVGSTIDVIAFILAVCSRNKKDEKFSNKIYSSLVELSDTPFHLFAFLYYRKYLIKSANTASDSSDQNKKPNQPKKIGRGLKKALIRWYSENNEIQLLRLLTQYKQSYDWSNKDLLKLIHMKPKSSATDLIMKYVMFGYDKVKEETPTAEVDTKLMQFIKDIEYLKVVNNDEEVAELIRKHHLNYDHLPSKIKKSKVIWPALLEQQSLKDFCQNINTLYKKRILDKDTPSEKFLIESIFNKENEDIINLHPSYACLACQIYEQLTSIGLIKMFKMTSISSINKNSQSQHNEKVRDALWNAFLASNENQKKTNSSWQIKQRVAIIVDINTHMRNDHTNGVPCLNPIDTSASIMIQLYYMMENPENLDMYAVTDKLNKMDSLDSNQSSQNQPDLNRIESLFQSYASIDNNPNESIFESAKQNKTNYDAFIFLTASDSNEKLLNDQMKSYRLTQNLPNSKLVLINLTSTTNSVTDQNQINELKHDLVWSKFDLKLNGWGFDSFFVLESFLKNVF